jgi:uncharacterized protein (TIGR03435 family)
MRSLSVLSIVIGGLLAVASEVASQSPAFEVVSVKPANANARGMSIETNRGRFVARGATLSFLVQYAYRLQAFQISGGPSWIDSDKFEIQARFDGNDNAENDDKLILMLQTVLGDRFKLRFHRETRQLPVYELVVAKNGPKLTPSNESTRPSMQGGGGQLTARHASIANLAGTLKRGLGREVIDKTGLKGFYDFKLVFTPDANQPPGAIPPGVPGPPRAPVDPNGPSIFTALQEQLGLKLEAAKGPVEILVVDNADKPSEN